ncbi:hypothetical protein IE81DRAFT_349517 [Ceraceosorus guamensis]|uniref:C2H2-type domain-containing protein n=1 Tax=Ceraceosorus guamensis TaxID=1522189 RepID=A0A316VRB0_9BASI|nr:hypothetical protein IE81DRAFT_349517 [Ceraceosorus guamensis]PWN40147.1 hypothetical protein IE81DRAFT_349517 [Ceraceosorus guamensis]
MNGSTVKQSQAGEETSRPSARQDTNDMDTSLLEGMDAETMAQVIMRQAFEQAELYNLSAGLASTSAVAPSNGASAKPAVGPTSAAASISNSTAKNVSPVSTPARPSQPAAPPQSSTSSSAVKAGVKRPRPVESASTTTAVSTTSRPPPRKPAPLQKSSATPSQSSPPRTAPGHPPPPASKPSAAPPIEPSATPVTESGGDQTLQAYAALNGQDLNAVARAAMGLDEHGEPLPGNEETHRELADALHRLSASQKQAHMAGKGDVSSTTNPISDPTPAPSKMVTPQRSAQFANIQSLYAENKETPATPTSPSDGGGEAPKRFQCPHCARAFARAFNLNTHIATHDPDPKRSKPYTCPYPACIALGGRSFSRKHDLQRHVAGTHESDPEPEINKDGRSGGLASIGLAAPGRKFRCNDCGRGFVRRDVLRRHLCDAAPGREGEANSSRDQEARKDDEAASPNANTKGNKMDEDDEEEEEEEEEASHRRSVHSSEVEEEPDMDAAAAAATAAAIAQVRNLFLGLPSTGGSTPESLFTSIPSPASCAPPTSAASQPPFMPARPPRPPLSRPAPRPNAGPSALPPPFRPSGNFPSGVRPPSRPPASPSSGARPQSSAYSSAGNLSVPTASVAPVSPPFYPRPPGAPGRPTTTTNQSKIVRPPIASRPPAPTSGNVAARSPAQAAAGTTGVARPPASANASTPQGPSRPHGQGEGSVARSAQATKTDTPAPSADPSSSTSTTS